MVVPKNYFSVKFRSHIKDLIVPVFMAQVLGLINVLHNIFIGGGSDILGELTTVSLTVSVTWVSLPVCSEIVKEMYVRDGLSTREIARRLGISKSTVLDRLRSTGVELRPRGRKNV